MRQAAERERQRREFILTGSIPRVVLTIAAPLILLGVFDYFYSILDTIVVAQAGSNAISSVAMIGQLTNLFTALGTGCATGCSILISRLIGKNDYARAKTVANTLFLIAVFLSVVLVSVLLPLARPILAAAKLSEELIAVGIGYFMIQIFVAGVNIVFSLFLGLEKARGATRNVLYLNLTIMAIKIAFTLFFIYGLHAQPTMVAAATLIAKSCGLGFAIFRLSRKQYLFSFSIKDTLFKREILKPFFRLSFPVFLGKFVFSFGKIIVNSTAMRYGDSAPGALGVSNNISGCVTNVTGSMEDATSVIVSQNLGAKQTKRALQAFGWAILVCLAIGAIGVTLITVFTDPIVGYFAQGDAEYGDLIRRIFEYERIGILFLALNSAVMGFIYGLGYTKLSMVFNLSRLFLFRIPVLFIMVYCFPQYGAESLGIAMCVSNISIGIVSSIIAGICILQIKKKGLTDSVRI